MNRVSIKNQDPIRFKKRQIYEELKKWDTNRGNALRFHINLVTHILRHIDKKTKSSKQYLNYIEGIMIKRLKQIEKYLDKGLTKSEFVLGKNPIKSYETHHALIKQLMLHESQKQLQLEHKSKRLRQIFNQFRALRQENPIDRDQQKSSETHLNQSANNTQMQGSSILILKYNVRELIQVELPQIAQMVHENSKKVSQIFHQNSNSSINEGKQDLYIQIVNLINSCQQLLQMHRKIGKQLIGLIESFIERQKSANKRLKSTLVKWLQEQHQISQPIIQQLLRKDDSALVQDFYSIEDMVTDFDYEEVVKNTSIKQHIVSFSIQSFELHEQLILCQFQEVFYNQKVELNIILTLDSFVHLKKYTFNKPEFSFILNKNIQMKKDRQFGLKICQKRKVYLFKSQTEWQFRVQFNSKEDLQHFIGTVKKISDCQLT